MKTRVNAVAVIQDERGKYLLAKMPENRGVFPGQWAIVGGGIEEGERIEVALAREIGEEVGLELLETTRWYFADEVREKLYPGGRREKLHLIYLYFKCLCRGEVKLNQEFEEFAWVELEDVNNYDLNEATRVTFEKLISEEASE